ncbi:MAG: ComEA family DNA-binding protein [Fervidobacterium sp.]
MPSLLHIFKTLYSKIKNEKVFFFIFTILVVLASIFYKPSNYSNNQLVVGRSSTLQQQASETQKRDYKSSIVDINTASIEDLQTLSGIGPSKAKAIVEYREKNRFTKPEDIMKVPGIGQKTYEKIKDRITVSKTEKLQEEENKESVVINTQNKNIQQNNQQENSTITGKESGKININTASLEELQQLPGIGPTKAQAVVDYRIKNGGFKTIEEIKKVNGIGDKTFEKLKDLITIK